MALSLDDYKRIAADAHPDWNDAQKEQWAQSKVSGSQSDSDKEEEGRWGLLSGLADWGRKAGTSISGWFDDLISDETAENSTIGKLGDMALNVVGGVLGGAVQSIAETPNFVGNLVSMPFTDKSEWGWSDVKDRARELQDEYGMNRAGAWLTAIDENNNSEHVGAQTIFQLLNNPLLGKGIGKGLDIVGGAIKGTGKTAQVVGKVANVADDAAKVSKGVKVAGAAEEVIEDTAKTAGKTSILSKIKNGYDKTKNYLKETTIGTKLKDAGVNTARFIGGPITDAYDILKVGFKTTRTAMKSSGVGSSLMQGIRATLGETVQTAGKFISKPLSYRTPRLWTTSTADMLLGDNVERGFAAGNKGDFRDEYGYSIDLVGYLNDDELQQYYDQNNIPQSKRLTADQIKEKQSQMGQNMFSDFTEGAKNLYEMFDIFSAPSFIMEQRRNNPGEVEVERNVRGEFRGFSNGKSINFSTGEVRDADGKAINLEDLTADELKEVGLLYEQKQAEEMGEGTPYTWSQQTGIKSNNITNVINNYAVNGMLTDTAENLVMTSDNAGVRANAVYINNQLNEASKEYVNSIIANYTVDEINSNPQLQEELRRSLDAYSLLFNTTADYISRMDDKEYDDVYRFKKALTSAYNLLDDDSKDLIDSNLYRKSIDYNNNLESGFDKFWMNAATWVKRSTDKMLNMFWSSDTNEWFEQGLSGLAGGVINPELASRGTAWGEISSGLRSNAAYAVDMVVLNKINDAVIEKFTGNMFDKAIRSNPKLYTKGFNGIKGGVTEMSSEFLENFTDAISMVEDPNTDYDFVTGFLFGMFQGAMAGYASSTDSYQSFKDYLTRPENRNAVLENMGIYVDAIEDPQQKAVMLSIVSQLMDDKSENNLIDIIVNTASQTNNGVENLMQAYALYQVNKMVGDYTNSLVGQVLDEVNSVDEWTPELIQQYFGTESDPTGRKNFNNYNTGKQFVFNSAVINDIKNREENKKQAETIAKTSAAFIKSSFKTAGMSFEEGLNFMAPKINASNGKKVITPIKKTRTVERDIVDQTTGNPIKDTVSVFVKTGEIAFTIGDKLGITSKNDKLFGEKKSRFGLKTTKGFKNKIEVKTTNEDGTEKTETLTMKDYLVKQLNEANLTDEERQFIGTVLFKTTVSGLNPYFKDDGSLTKLGEDFLKQVMPQLEERTSTVDFFVNLASIQTLKEAQVEKSKNDAMKESGANDDPIPTLNIGGQAVEAGTNVSNLSDDTELLIEKDGKKATIRDLKNGGITVSDNGRLCTMRIKEDGTLDIIYDEEEVEQPFEEEQTQQQQTGMPIQQEDGTILFAEDQRLDSLSEEEFKKEYDQAEKDRAEARRKYYAMEEEINKNPSRSDTARDQRFDTLVRLQREAYKATHKKKRFEESKKRRAAKNNNVQTQQQQKVEEPDNIKTYGSKYVLDNMSGQSQIKDSYGHKVKSVKLTISERNDVDKSQLTLPPEGVDFMDYQIDGGIHLIVDKQGNVYTVFDAGRFGSEHFFETGIVKKGDEGVDNDIIDYLESINDRSLIEEGWILKVDYDYYVKHKKDILDGTEKPNWEKLHKNFVDFIESKRQSSDNDDTTPPPAAPVVQEEQPNEAVQQVQERLNQVWTALPGATGEKVVQDTNPDTMKTTIPVSVYEHDHQDLQGKFVDVKTLLGKWDNLKSYIPYFVRNDQNVEKPINNRFEQFEYPENLKHLTQSQLNTKYYQDQLPKVNIRQKDGTVKTYSLVFVGEGPITDIVGVTRKGMRRHNYFRSYTLVDFKTERVDVNITSTIRPTWKWNEKLDKKPQALFYNNNRAITIRKKDGSSMEGNRVLSFTRANDKQKNGTWGPDNWFISTTVQMERMGESDHDLAFKNKRVFMNAPSNDSDRKGFLYNFETRQVEQVKYDGRNIFTTSDIVFDDNNEIITIGDVDINIADRSYSNPIELKGKTNGLEEHTLQDWFNMLWDKGQTMKADGTTTDMSSNRKKISDVKKEFKEIVKTQNDNVEMVVEQAENTVTEPTESVEETILKNTESFKAGGTQESLFGGPSLDSVKSSVEDRINKIMDIAGREQNINDRIEDIKQDIEDLENEDNPDQEDIDSLNAEKNELVDQLETLSTFQKIVDESEDFDTIEQYLNSELNRLKEGDTNTIMDMASEYGILEANNTNLSSIPWEESTVQEEAVAEEESETATAEPEESQTVFTESAGSYSQRTRENAANSDATIAFAYDFNTAGEKLTKSAAGNKYNSINIKNLSYQTLQSKMYEIANKLPNDRDLTINIAGNGMYTLSENSDSDQEYYNKLLQEAISMLLRVRPNIKTIISGGQTGIDEAGIIAGQRLGLKTIVNAPKGWKFRDASGKDISDENKFKSRFGTEAASTDNTTTSNEGEGNSGYEVQENNFDAKGIWDGGKGKIPAVRRDVDGNPNHSFGNPFDGWTKTVKVKDEKTGKIVSRAEYGVAEATRRFYKWLRGTDYQNVKPEQRKWIVDQIKNGSLRGKTVVYYTKDVPNKYKGNDVNDYGVKEYDAKHPNHAMVLQRFINGEYTIIEPSTSTEAVMVSEGSVQSPNRYVTPKVPMLALPEPAGSRIISNNGLMLTQKEIESIQYGLDKYTRNATMPLPLNGTVALNDERTIFLHHGQFGLYLEKQSNPDIRPERVSYVFSSEAGLANFVKSLTSAENILDNLDEEVMPEPSDLLAEEYPSNRVIGARLLTDKARLDQMVKDCEELGIVLGALDARALGQIILAYTKNGRGIDEVLEKFASDIPSSNVDEKLVDIMIKKGILSNAGTYGGLSLSQILAYNYGLKKIKKDQVKDIIGKTYITIGNGGKIYGLSYSKREDLLDLITDYYIKNYLNLDPAAFGPYSKFREKFRAKVEAKLLSSEIYVHKKGTHSALDDKEDVNMFLDLLHINPELRKGFVEAAYTNQINAKPPRKPLITLSQYNYLMESDPFMTVIGNEGDYQVGPIGSSVLESINKITEIGEITGENANRRKLQLLFDIYTYYQGSRKASYEGLVKFLRNKYRYSELNEDHTMKKLIDVIEEDSKLSGTSIHSEGVMMTLRSSNRESYEGDPYQNFIKSERGDNSIIDALIILESNDENSFQQIVEYAPKKIKDELYERFQEENRENKSSNIAYRMVSGLLLNNYKVINDLKKESQKGFPKVEGAVRDMLLGFNPMSLVNSAATRVLYNKFGLRGLDLNKGTVILTNNRQNSLGKWMPNFNNVERFPLLPVSSLNDIKADVNVIVPYGVSIPKDSNGYNYNIIRMENAGYQDGALVVGKIGNRVVDFGNRMYNIMGLYGLGVIQSNGFTISKEHKNIIKDNRTQKSLYWNIFKNNILPNLGEDFQNITEDDFYQSITSKAMKKVNLNMLYKCFAAGDMQELIDNSIAVINAVTNNEFKLRSNNAAGRKTIDTYDAINQFSKFISKQSLSNKAKERIAKMFGDFLMIQMKIGEINIADRRTEFKTAHSRALDELYKLPDIKNAQVGGLELWQIFVNGNLTKKEEPTKQQIEDAIIDAEIDKKNISKMIVNKINDREDEIRKLEKQIQDIWDQHGNRSPIGEEKIKNKTNELYNARQELEDLEEKYEDKRTPEQKKEIADKDKELSKATTERYKLRQKLGNDAAEVKAKNDEVERLSRELADLKKKYVNNYTTEGRLQIEKKKSDISLLESQLGELEKEYLVSVSKEHRDEIRQLRLKINQIDSEIYNLENDLDDVNGKNYYQNDYIEHVNEASGVQSTQNLEEAQNSMILTDEAEDQNRIFSGKAMKVLEYLYNNYIKNNAVTVEPGQSKNTRNHVVSKDLMGMLIGENTFNNTYGDVIEGNIKVKRFAYSQSDLNQLIGILTSLKKTNAKRFKEVLDDIFRTYEDIGYTYDTPEHLDLIKYKSEVANNPANLYKIFSDLSNDKRFSIQFLEGGKVEKKLNYKDINMDGLLQSASKEYFEGSPYIVRTAEGVENMNKKVKEYHEKYDKYFDKLLPDGVKPSDEQIKGFAKLKFTFDKRKNKRLSSSKSKVFAIPGIAGAGKTTMLTAFFRYVNEVGGAQYEVDNIANGKQTSIIYQFSPKEHSAFYRAKADDVFYAKIENKDKGGGEIYIKFKKGDMKDHDSLLKMSDEDVLKGFSNIWGKEAVPALIEKGEGYEKKWLDKRDNQLKSGSYSVWKINEFEIVTDPKKVPANPIIIKGNDGTLAPDASRYQDFPAIESNRALSDIHFAVRMHQTISSLKSTFSNEQKFNGIDYGTEASYMTQANSVNMDLFGYNDSPVVKKQMEGQFIIIDEAQNSYNSDLQAITEQLGGNNVVVMLGDFHQNSKGDFFKNLSEDGKYMVETHRGTEDINIMNEINAFTQNALIKANAVGFYMNDSDDFRRYDSVSPERYRGKPNEYLMVCRKNKTRKDLNAKYLESLGATIEYDKEGKIKDVSDIQPIIDSKAKLQVMVVDVLSDKKMNKRGRKSEMPNEGLDMEGFQKSELGNCYYKETDGSLQLFFPYTETSNYEGDIKNISKSDYIKKLANGKDIEIFVPAFAITTEKESGKTVDNIILHDELVNIEYDSLSEQNVQTFYDAFTRGSKKVYIPQKAPRLIGITREDAKNLMEGKPLSKGYVEATSDKVSVDDFTMPVVTVRPEGGLDVLDDIDYLLGLGNFAGSELSEAVGILRNYNMGNQTFGDYEYQGEHKSNDYVDVLKKRVADLWDQNREWIKTTLENQGVVGENIEDRFYKINVIIYGRVYKVPLVRDEKGNFQYWDGKEGQNDYRIWGNTKWQNKIITLDDFKQYGMQIENGIATEGQVYRPQILQDKGKLVMKMVKVNGRWVQKTTKGRIERRNRKEKETLDIEAQKMEIERIFNFQFDNDVISEEGFRIQDYKPIAGDGININASLAKTPAELWTSNKKKGTIFEMNPNMSIEEKLDLINTLKDALRNKVDEYYSALSEDDLYREREYVPYTGTVKRISIPSLMNDLGITFDKKTLKKSDINFLDNLSDERDLDRLIDRIYNRYKGSLNHSTGKLLTMEDVKRAVRTISGVSNDVSNAERAQFIYDETHEATALQRDYETIMNQIDNIKVVSAVDNSRLDGLKNNIISFMERVYDIENRENFVGYDNEEFGEGGTFSLNDEGLYSSCEDAENCGG